MTSSNCKSNKPAEINAPAPLSGAHVRNIFYGLMLGMFLSALNQTIVATALPTIGRDFGDFENLSWVIIAYLLSSTVVSPLYGKLSDIHGRRAMMLVAIGLFIAFNHQLLRDGHLVVHRPFLHAPADILGPLIPDGDPHGPR